VLAASAAWIVAFSLAPAGAHAALATGATAPTFRARAALAGHELEYSLADELHKGPVVVYFYPSAFTGGCDREAHAFAEQMDQFHKAGATVVGVSLDSIQRLVDFSSDPQYCAGKVLEVSDADGAIAKSYEVAVSPGKDEATDVRGQKIGHGFADRTTFVVDKDGKVVASISHVSPEDHVGPALAAVQKLSTRGA
jgi:peroxiredoxin